MRKLIISLVFLNAFVAGYSQIIKGTVIDQNTKVKISFAYVYFNGTFIGTNSNKDGDFAIDISKYPSMPLTVSALGYYSVTLNNIIAGKPVVVYMKPKVFELNEVVINSKSKHNERKRNLRIFKEAFLGATRNSGECEITNEKDLMFKSDNDTLKAYSLNPILIHNKALGYKITYFLDQFDYDKRNESLFFIGSIIFTEDLESNETQKKTFESERRKVYQGSRMHFFRLLWENSLDSTNFTVENPAEEKLIYPNIVIEEDSITKYLQYPENLGICYHSVSPSSYIIFLHDRVNFDKYGYFDPYGITWQGQMSEQRIADWLPYEYSDK